MSLWLQMLFGALFGMVFGIFCGTYDVDFNLAGGIAAGLTFAVMLIWYRLDRDNSDDDEFPL